MRSLHLLDIRAKSQSSFLRTTRRPALASADLRNPAVVHRISQARQAFFQVPFPDSPRCFLPFVDLLFSLNVPPIALYKTQASASPSRPLRGPAMSALRLKFEKSSFKTSEATAVAGNRVPDRRPRVGLGHSGSNGAATDLVPRQ